MARPVARRRGFRRGRVPRSTGCGLAGRAEGPHTWGGRAAPADLRRGIVSPSSPWPAAVRGLRLLLMRSRPPAGLALRRTLRASVGENVTRRWACGWNLPQAAAWHGSAVGQPPEHDGVTRDRPRCPASGSGRAAGPGDGLGAVGRAELAQAVADVPWPYRN